MGLGLQRLGLSVEGGAAVSDEVGQLRLVGVRVRVRVGVRVKVRVWVGVGLR